MNRADRDALYARMELAGHKLKRNEDGAVEYFDHGEFHGGPECENCYYAPCEHCRDIPVCEIEPCNRYEKAYIGFAGPLFKASWERMVLLAAINSVAVPLSPQLNISKKQMLNAYGAYLKCVTQ